MPRGATIAEEVTKCEKEIINLRRVERQMRGIVRMIAEKHCRGDALPHLSPVRCALPRVKEHILEIRIRGYVGKAIKGSKQIEKEKLKKHFGINGGRKEKGLWERGNERWTESI